MSYFNKEKPFADIHKEICKNFKFKKKKTLIKHALPIHFNVKFKVQLIGQ